MSVGSKIRLYRKKKGLSQRELAAKMNRSKGLVGFWETDKREPSNSDMVKLSEILDVDISLLFDIPKYSNTETYEVNPEQILRPIVGVVKAGYNMYCEQNILGYKAVEKSKTKGAETFWLKVKGDSMNAVGILDGSLVLGLCCSYIIYRKHMLRSCYVRAWLVWFF